MEHPEDPDLLPAAPRAGRRPVLRTVAVRAGLALLVALALFGAWSIYALLTDPFRLASRAVDDGTAAAAVSRAIAGQRACASVLGGLEPFEMYAPGMADLPSVRALRAAGLIEPVPEAERPKGGRDPLFRLTRAATPFVQAYRTGSNRHLYLCYGRPKLAWAYLSSDESSDPSPRLRVKYTIGDRPAWADRPGMRAAFPFLNDVTGEPVLHYLGLYFRGRRVVTDNFYVEPALDVPSATSGFGFCPMDRRLSDKGCVERD